MLMNSTEHHCPRQLKSVLYGIGTTSAPLLFFHWSIAISSLGDRLKNGSLTFFLPLFNLEILLAHIYLPYSSGAESLADEELSYNGTLL